jgi:serine/threonine protein kinase
MKVTGKNTAVKIIAKKKLSDDDLAALMTEISILAEMDHPHIIKYVSCNIRTCYYFCLPWVVIDENLFAESENVKRRSKERVISRIWDPAPIFHSIGNMNVMLVQQSAVKIRKESK